MFGVNKKHECQKCAVQHKNILLGEKEQSTGFLLENLLRGCPTGLCVIFGAKEIWHGKTENV